MINLADLQLWQPPWKTNGSAALIRISSTALKNVSGSCAAEKVAKAYVGLYTEARDWSQRKDPRAVFLLGAARTVLSAQRTPANLTEVIAAELGVDATQPSLLAAKTMVQNALNATEDFAAEDLAVDLVMQPTADFVCVATTDNQRLELTSWGVFYQSADKSVRELRLFCYRDAQTTRDKNQLVAAVNILLNGAITDGPIARWTDPHQTLPTNPPLRVRVRQIGCLDSSAATLFDGDASSAAAFVGGISTLVQDFLLAPEFQPGNSCVECRFRIGCTAITKVPGFLGLPTAGKISKSLSRSMLSAYQRCNYQYFLTYVLKLPKKAFESNGAIERGNAVHEWIMKAHQRQQACTAADLPDEQLGVIGASLGWPISYLDQARSWIKSHFAVCPFQHSDTKLVSEQSRTVWDSDADVVITTRADELGTRAGMPIWRELKTTSVIQELTANDYLMLYPQVAFAICIQEEVGGSVELELLTPELGKLFSFDVTDPAIVLTARRSIAMNFDQLHHDESFKANPGTACLSCAVSTWCDQRVINSETTHEKLADGLEVDLVTGEIITSQPVAIDALARALALVDTVDVVDDLPF